MLKPRTLLIVGVIGLLLLILVGGIAFWGWNLFADQAKTALNNNPVIRQHIGEIDSLETDFMATGEAESADVFVFRVKGAKGSGVVTAEFESVSDEAEEIRSGTLRLSSGETYDLLEQAPPLREDDANR